MIKKTKAVALSVLLMTVMATSANALTGQRVEPELHVFNRPGGGLFSCPLWADEITCAAFTGAEVCEMDFVSCVAAAAAAADGTAAAVADFAFKTCRACENTEPGQAIEHLADLAADVCEVAQCSFSVCEGPVTKTALVFCRSEVELEACRSACAERVGR